MRLAAEIEPGLSRSYVYHPDQPYTPLARCDSACSDGLAQAGGRILWFHTNPLGTPEALADQDGMLRWQSQYRAWGELDAAQGGEHQPLRFPGQYHDSESGLHYNTFRYYDPETGRYLSPDPIGLAGGLNLYSYVPDPNGWMDPWGCACNPIHHLATNKHSHWSPRFRKLFNDYGLGRFKNGRPRSDVLNDPLNKVRIPGHKGPHPDDSHQYLFDRLKNAAKIGSANGGGKAGGKAAIEAELELLKIEATTVGKWLNKVLTKT